MRTLFSRRRALQALSTLPAALSIGGGITGCSGGDGSGSDSAEANAAKLGLGRYRKIVVLIMENRSFDHYFGHLSLPVDQGGEGRKDVNGFKSLDAHTNLDLNGNKVGIFRPDHHAIGDIDHEWDACHEQFDGGKNDGFVKSHQEDLERLNDGDDKTKANCFGFKDDQGVKRCGKPNEPMAFYNRTDTPIYHQLLDEYVLCDNWFASVMGPTWPNRFYLHAASSGGKKSNNSLWGLGSEARHSIFGRMTSNGRQFRKDYPEVQGDRFCVDFFTDVPLLPIMFPTALGQGGGFDFIDFLPDFNYAHLLDAPREGGIQALEQISGKVFGDRVPTSLIKFIADARKHPTFETLAREGKLPPVSYIEPPFQLAPMDDHPPHDIGAGQAFVSLVYNMLFGPHADEKQAAETLLVITYDEHGSFYDHVAPGVVQQDERAEFRQLGFRVPAIVIGKGTKQGPDGRGIVSHKQYDHCSVLSTITNRFGLTPSNDRVHVANDLSDCFDLSGRGAAGSMKLKTIDLSESQILESARMAKGQGEIVDRVFHGEVPYEAKRQFTNYMLEILDRKGIANIRR